MNTLLTYHQRWSVLWLWEHLLHFWYHHWQPLVCWSTLWSNGNEMMESIHMSSLHIRYYLSWLFRWTTKLSQIIYIRFTAESFSNMENSQSTSQNVTPAESRFVLLPVWWRHNEQVLFALWGFAHEQWSNPHQHVPLADKIQWSVCKWCKINFPISESLIWTKTNFSPISQSSHEWKIGTVTLRDLDLTVFKNRIIKTPNRPAANQLFS